MASLLSYGFICLGFLGYKSWVIQHVWHYLEILHRMNTSEQAYKDAMLKLYGDGRSLLLPKSDYYKLLDEVREAVAKEKNKTRKEFYLLTK